VVNEDAAHEGGGDGEEVGAGLPVDLLDAGEAEIGFVDEGGGLEGVVGCFAAEVDGGDAAQFGVDERDKPFFCLPVALFQFDEELGNVAGGLQVFLFTLN
jgi:hypothetical protein